jgi:hypothetical protein
MNGYSFCLRRFCCHHLFVIASIIFIWPISLGLLFLRVQLI